MTGATDVPVRRLVLLRHGRTEWNAVERAQGHADIPLDAVGTAQAQAAAGQLAAYRPARLWSSDLARARQTADAVAAATGVEVVVDARLREIDVGARTGMTIAEFREAFPELVAQLRAGERPAIPGAEEPASVAARMLAVLGEVIEATVPGETSVVVSHGAALRIALLAFFGVPEHASEMLSGLGNCAWAVLEEHPDRGWQIVDYNAKTLPEPLQLADDLPSA